MPKFADSQAWHQAEQLMQPALIRVIDNIRKQLEESSWQESYADTQVWPEGTSPKQQQAVLDLQAQIQQAEAENADPTPLKQALADLPQPYPGYELRLSQSGQPAQAIDLWTLCYRVCFRNYDPTQAATDPVEIDAALLDQDGEVDWNALDEKAQGLVKAVFEQLPRAA